MGKSENSKNTKNGRNIYRKTLLGNSTLAIILQPTVLSPSSSSTAAAGFQKQVNCENKELDFSAKSLFMLFKDANKVMVKGAKLYESLNEMRLSGWINPYTLLLIGPSEDMKVLKHAWVKRHLKDPKGYSIKDIGK